MLAKEGVAAARDAPTNTLMMRGRQPAGSRAAAEFVDDTKSKHLCGPLVHLGAKRETAKIEWKQTQS